MRPIEWIRGRVRLLDQTRLPTETVYVDLDDYREVVKAVEEMKVRGAPAIGVAGAYAVALAAQEISTGALEDFLRQLDGAASEIMAARPTGANLEWAVRRMLRFAARCDSVESAKSMLPEEAITIHREGEDADGRISELGSGLLDGDVTVLTLCNTGSLATGGYGTALGVIKRGWEQGRIRKVMVCETRPLLQGARLTSWELAQEGIPCTLIVDSAAGYVFDRGDVDAVIVGADRIAANGDVANKVGTYTLAVLAKQHSVSFYVAAPTSTIDTALRSGEMIPIEERSREEVAAFSGAPTAPPEIDVFNPAFDVTPHGYVTAIVTEIGVLREPYYATIGSSVGGVIHV